MKVSHEQKLKLRLATLSKPYIILFPVWFILFVILNIFLNEIHIIGTGIFDLPPRIYMPFIFFTIVNGALVSLNINLIIIKLKDFENMSKRGGVFGTIGTMFAFIAGACPGCVAGLFPAFMGIFGSTFTLNSLPLGGLEIQITSLILLLMGAYYLAKGTTCKIKLKV